MDKKTKKQLLKESTFEWGINYPKEKDLVWKKKNLENGEWEDRESIPYDPSAINFNTSVDKAFNKYINIPKCIDIEDMFE